MHPLPASEVRRLGDRMRRRRNLLASVGGVVAALVLVVTPLTVVSTRAAEGSGPGFADPGPSTGLVTAVPRDFPLGDGMGPPDGSDPATVGEHRGEVVLDSLAVCGRDLWSPDAPEVHDVLGAVWSDGVEGGEQRTLALLDSDRAAQDVVDRVRAAVAGCPEPDPGRDAVRPIALAVSAGEGASVHLDQYADPAGPTGEGVLVLVVRVGHAVLLDRTYLGGAGDLALAQDEADALVAGSAEVVRAMTDLVRADDRRGDD